MNILVDTTKGVGFCQTPSPSFTETYFFEEILRLREQWSNSKFWERSEDERDRMIDGLNHIYLNLAPDDNSKITHEHLARWGGHYIQTMAEYNRRGTMTILGNPFVLFGEQRPNCPECKRPHGVARGEDGIFRCHMVDHKVPVICNDGQDESHMVDHKVPVICNDGQDEMWDDIERRHAQSIRPLENR